MVSISDLNFEDDQFSIPVFEANEHSDKFTPLSPQFHEIIFLMFQHLFQTILGFCE